MKFQRPIPNNYLIYIHAILLVLCSHRFSAFISETHLLVLFVLARGEVHITGRNCLIVIPDLDCVGGGLGRACAVLWIPAGRV